MISRNHHLRLQIPAAALLLLGCADSPEGGDETLVPMNSASDVAAASTTPENPPGTASSPSASSDNPPATAGQATSAQPRPNPSTAHTGSTSAEPSGSPSPDPTTTPTGDPSSSTPAASSDGAGGHAGSQSIDPQQGGGGAVDEPPTGEPEVRLVGRFEQSDSSGARFSWSGSAIIAAFEGSSVSVTLEDSGTNQFSVFVDGQLTETLDAQAGSHEYPLAMGLEPGTHTVELYRRTEASEGPSRFVSFAFGEGGKLLAPPPPRAHRLEIIGDSITCGYGNEGPNMDCHYTPETENHTLSYGAVAARALDADLVTVAWSGKGIVYNYDADTNLPLPELYDRIIPTEADSVHDFEFSPEAVVINLGTNDFSTDGDPTPELFHERYAGFLEHIRSKYPEAFILCTVGPMLSGADLDAARAGIAAAVQTRVDAGDANVGAWEMNIGNDSPGCDWHPSVATHQLMADGLVAELRAALGW